MHELLGGNKHYELNVVERGFRPVGEGKVLFKVYSIKKSLNPIISNNKKILVKRVRGTAIASKVSLDFINKMINKTREILNDYIPDVWIYSELVKNKK